MRRQQFIKSRGSQDWPDGTVANRYAFVHAMYQEGLGSRVSEARRVEWQGRIGAREEQAYGVDARDIAAQLAVRFEAARQYDRSVKYFELAARNALSSNAYIEADRLYGKAIDMLPLARLDDPTKVELRMLLPRSVAVIATHGYATDEIDKIHQRALTLARDRGDTPAVVRVLHSIWTTYLAQGQLHKARRSPSRFPTMPSSRPTRPRCCRRTPSSARPASISANSPWHAPISRMRWRSRSACRTRNGHVSRATSPGPCGIWAFPMPPAE